jgi:hypothetical protein
MVLREYFIAACFVLIMLPHSLKTHLTLDTKAESQVSTQICGPSHTVITIVERSRPEEDALEGDAVGVGALGEGPQVALPVAGRLIHGTPPPARQLAQLQQLCAVKGLVSKWNHIRTACMNSAALCRVSAVTKDIRKW